MKGAVASLGASTDRAYPTTVKVFNRICLVVGAALLAWMIRSIGAGEVAALLADVGVWFALIVVVAFAGTLAETRAQHLFLGPAEAEVPFRRVLAAKLAGQAINLLTPGAAMGEATKVSLLMGHAPQARIISSVILFNVVLLLLACGFAVAIPLITISLVRVPEAVKDAIAISSVLLGIAVLILIVLMRRGALGVLIDVGARVGVLSKKRADKWRDSAVAIDGQVRALRREDPRRFWHGVGFMLLARFLSLFEAWVILHALGGRSGVLFTALVASVGTVIGWIAGLVPLGIGTAEGGGYLLFTVLGENPALGLVMPLVQRLRKIVLIAIGLAVLAWSQAGEPWLATLRGRRSPSRPATEPRQS